MSLMHFQPDSVDKLLTQQLSSLVSDSVAAFIAEREAAGWKFYVVRRDRGVCYYRSHVITIPVWALQRDIDFRNWYVSHEIAHTFAIGDHHGKLFMEALMRICPANALYHELGYKPRAASGAGIKKPVVISRKNAEGAL